eukprot:114985-Pyramimonas_sp.AAC.1
MAGNHWNRFRDIRRVRLSNPELQTLSAKLGSQTIRIVRVIRGAVVSLHLSRAVDGAAGLVIPPARIF